MKFAVRITAVAFALFIASTPAGSAHALAQTPAQGTSLAERIGHTDPANRGSGRSHGSLNDMKCQTVIGRGVIPYLNFIHRCEMTAPNGGVGAHFHNTGEEMFVVFDGEAEFTIDGRTSLLKGHVVGAPVRMGHSHAIINPTNRPMEFMNIQVGAVDGEPSDAFNLGDPRLNAPKDSLPVFMTMRLETAQTPEPTRTGRRGPGNPNAAGQWGPTGALRTIENYHGGKGLVRYRRALYPVIFSTNWEYVDHLLLAPGAIDGLHRHPSLSEIYYVIDGDGEITVGNETATIHKGDAAPVRANEAHSLRNTGSRELELLIIGISTRKGALETVEVSSAR